MALHSPPSPFFLSLLPPSFFFYCSFTKEGSFFPFAVAPWFSLFPLLSLVSSLPSSLP